MSEENKEGQQPQGLQIKKTMVILKSPGSNLSNIESFLKNRQWAIHSSTQLKEALAFIIQNKPSFVLISVDHPNKKVRALPKLLLQAFPVCVIAFAEKSNTQSYKLLMESGCEYRINPPVTGPSVERAVNKYIRDQEKAMEEAARGGRDPAGRPDSLNQGIGAQVMKGQESGNASAGGMVSIKGGAGQAGGPAYSGSAMGGDGQNQGAAFSGGGFDTSSMANILKAMGEDAGDLAGISSEDTSFGSGSGFNTSRNSKDHAPGISMSASSGADKKDKNKSDVGEAGFLSGSGSDINQDSDSADSSGGLMTAKGQRSKSGSMTQEGAGFEGGSFTGQGPKHQGGSFSQGRPEDADGGDFNAGKNMSGGPNFVGAGPLGETKDSKPNSANDPSAAGGFGGQAGSMGGPGYMPKHGDSNSKQGPQVTYNESDYEGAQNSGGLNPNQAGSVTGGFGGRKNKADFKPVGKEIEDGDLNTAQAGGGDVVRIRGQGHQKEESIMVRGTQKALDESVNVRDGRVVDKIEGSSSVACIVVESPKFSGYLVAAMGKNRKIDDKFIETVREKLMKFLKESGEEISTEAGMGIKIKQVDFEDWSIEYADFLRKSVHNGDEVAMAFFPFAQANIALGESAHAEMGTVRMEDLQGDIPVEFNLYIHLPANNKYVLYTPRGSTFYGNQKERLGKSGITHMHMKKAEAQDLSKYRAQNYLNSKIAEYEKKKAEKQQQKAS